MPFNKCIGALVGVGKMNTRQATKFQKELDERTERLYNIYKREKDGSDAELFKKAETDAINQLQAEARDTAFRAAERVRIEQDLTKKILAHEDGATAAMREELQLAEAEIAGSVASKLNNKLGKFVETYRNKVPFIGDLFLPKRAQLEFAKARHGDTVNIAPEIMEFSRGYGEVLEEYRQAFKQHGVFIPEIDNFGLRHRWNSVKMHKAGKADFVQSMVERVDEGRMVNEDGSLMSKVQIRNLLNNMYDDIVSGGTASGRTGRRVPGSGFKKHRTVHFKSGNDWASMHSKFGDGNIYENAVNLLTDLQRELTMLRRFGPDPDKTFKSLRDTAKKDLEARKQAGEGTKLANPIIGLDKQWDVLSGKIYEVVNPKFANVMAGTRSITVADALGSSLLSAISDVKFIREAANAYGRSVWPVLMKMAKQIAIQSPLGSERAKVLARRYSTAMDDITAGMGTISRFDEMNAIGKYSKVGGLLADGVVRSALLSLWTRSGKAALSKFINSEIADHAAKAFSELPDKMKKTFQKYDISEADWDNMRGTLSKIGKDKFIDTDKLWKKDTDTAAKFNAMLTEETRMGIPEPSIETKAVTTQGQPLGTAGRELTATIASLKSFAIESTLLTLRRGFLDKRVNNKATFFVNHALLTLALGGLALQLDQLALGKDFIDPTSPEFIVKAMLKGGSTGIAGDFAQLAGSNKTQMLSALGGPVALFVVESMGLINNGIPVVTGDKELDAYLSEIARFAETHTPGSNLWYSKLMAQRYFWDQLQLMADPKTAKRYKKYEKRLEKESGQEFYWPRGKTQPKRTPRIAEDKD